MQICSALVQNLLALQRLIFRHHMIQILHCSFPQVAVIGTFSLFSVTYILALRWDSFAREHILVSQADLGSSDLQMTGTALRDYQHHAAQLWQRGIKLGPYR